MPQPVVVLRVNHIYAVSPMRQRLRDPVDLNSVAAEVAGRFERRDDTEIHRLRLEKNFFTGIYTAAERRISGDFPVNSTSIPQSLPLHGG